MASARQDSRGCAQLGRPQRAGEGVLLDTGTRGLEAQNVWREPSPTPHRRSSRHRLRSDAPAWSVNPGHLVPLGT